ncbi:MAG: hypothetical protein OXE94_04765 [Aestuariivita sp.]|nr:hypothetical protein [Aestuariivita sp.]
MPVSKGFGVGFLAGFTPGHAGDGFALIAGHLLLLALSPEL